MTKTPTLNEAVERLGARGYEERFVAESEGLLASDAGEIHPPGELCVDEVVHCGEGHSVLAVRSLKSGLRGTFAVTEGPGSLQAQCAYDLRREQPERRLDELLRGVEDECLQPVVPGELERWVDVVEPSLGRVGEAWSIAEKARAETEQEIEEQDPGLATRAEDMRQERADLGARLDELRRTARELLARNREDPTGSEEPHGRAREFRRDALNWIVEARAHGAEIRTWKAEALRRDRGEVD